MKILKVFLEPALLRRVDASPARVVRRPRAPRCLCALVILILPALAHAEGFLDFAIGGSFTQKNDVKFKAGGSSVSTRAEFDDSYTGGVRGGYWFEQMPWLGVGGMISYFEPDVKPEHVSGYDDRDFGVVPITFLLMLRAPLLPSADVPRGQLQPYLNVGPGVFITAIDDNHDDYYDDDHHHHHNHDDAWADAGVDVHAGATWMFNSRFGVFGEYRFTHYEANIDSDSHDYGNDLELSTTLDTHHVLAGFAWHFD